MLAFFFGLKHPLSQIIGDYWPILPAAFVVSVLATPLCRRLALRFNVMDYPNHDVKTHIQPTAYLGGISILVGLGAGLLVGLWVLDRSNVLSTANGSAASYKGGYPHWLMLIGIGFGATIASLVGLLDDIVDIRPWQKLIGQALAAAVLVAVGVRPNLCHFLGQIGMELPPLWDFVLGVPIVLFFILGATNSLNLLDGLDGLCAGVTSIITIAFLLLALTLATWAYSPVGDPVRLIVCLALVGATLGFLPMNRYPASIFMGDAGSMLLGLVAGTVMILFTEGVGRWSISAIIIFGLPILDTAVALVRRFINHKPLLASDRGHIYDQLMDRGVPLRRSVHICYLLAGVYALIGLAVSQIRFRYAVGVFGLVVIVSALMVWWRGFLQIPSKDEPADP